MASGLPLTETHTTVETTGHTTSHNDLAHYINLVIDPTTGKVAATMIPLVDNNNGSVTLG